MNSQEKNDTALDLTSFNPAADLNAQNMKALRIAASCSVPEEAQKIQAHMNRLITLPNADDYHDTLARGVASIMLSENICKKSLRKRVAAPLTGDNPTIEQAHKEVQELTQQLNAKETELVEISQKLQQALVKRWETAVSQYGLNPKKYLYAIDEANNTINMLELDCGTCKAATQARKVRQELDSALTSSESKPV